MIRFIKKKRNFWKKQVDWKQKEHWKLTKRFLQNKFQIWCLTPGYVTIYIAVQSAITFYKNFLCCVFGIFFIIQYLKSRCKHHFLILLHQVVKCTCIAIECAMNINGINVTLQNSLLDGKIYGDIIFTGQLSIS